MPCSSGQYPPSPYDRIDPDYDAIRSELKLRLTEIKHLSKIVMKHEDEIKSLKEEYKKLLQYYSLMGNGS